MLLIPTLFTTNGQLSDWSLLRGMVVLPWDLPNSSAYFIVYFLPSLPIIINGRLELLVRIPLFNRVHSKDDITRS